jgi:hypothetical protein
LGIEFELGTVRMRVQFEVRRYWEKIGQTLGTNAGDERIGIRAIIVGTDGKIASMLNMFRKVAMVLTCTRIKFSAI